MISKKEAFNIAQKLYGDRIAADYEVNNYQDTSYVAYVTTNHSNVWCVSFLDNSFEGIQSTTIVLIHKETGDILYQGSGGDEG